MFFVIIFSLKKVYINRNPNKLPLTEWKIKKNTILVINNYFLNFNIIYIKDQNYEASYSFLGNLGRKKKMLFNLFDDSLG